MIRAARIDELAHLQAVERAAGEAFRDVGMGEIADEPPLSLDQLAVFAEAGRAWVRADPGDPACAYLVASHIEGALHIEQVSVHPDRASWGIGRTLIEHAAAWAATHGCDVVTLTTFVDVPWNAPYYRRLGFRPVPDDRWPWLRRLREREAAAGLDRWPRIAMARPLP